MRAQRGIAVWLYSFFNLSSRLGFYGKPTSQLLYLWEREPVPIVQEGGWAPGPVWMGAENLAPSGI